jgi:metallo-beta-lactamase family protein
VHITEVFRKNWDMFDHETQEFFSPVGNLFDNENITYITDVEESKKLHDKTGPMIIISASGMCENGRILHHLKNNIENPLNMVLIAGYMAENTLGRKIVEKQKMVNIFGRPYHLKAEVVTLDSFSSHADHHGLVSYVRAARGRLKQVFVVHGEPAHSEKLCQSIRSLEERVSIPSKNEEVVL